MGEMTTLVNLVYVYCTDFIISLANLFHLSYYEVNTLFFCIVYPLGLVLLLVVFVWQKSRLKTLKTGSRSSNLS
jgi:uncharacterized membrane protein YqjE